MNNKVESSLMLDKNLLSKIPKEILHIILDYYGNIYYKNGKYINKIHKYDERYKLIKNISPPRTFLNEDNIAFNVTINLTKEYTITIYRYIFCKYIHTYLISKKNRTVNMTEYKVKI